MNSINLMLFVALLNLLNILNVTSDENAAPNFLLIVADDLGYSDLSLTGSPLINTPNIDELARSQSGTGRVFSQFTVDAPICTPSRAAMLTGRLPIRSGIYCDLDYPYDNFFRVFYPSR